MQNSELLVDHYHKTYDLTFKIWESRNKNLLILLTLVGCSVLLTFNVAETQPLLVDIIAKLCGITDASRMLELRKSFPYGIIQSIFLIVTLYLMINLFHKTRFIKRNYEYLGGLESDIRSAMSLQNSNVSFTREGAFYSQNYSVSSKITGLSYVLILGVLLISFTAMRLITDWDSKQLYNFSIDLLISIALAYFFISYALISLKK